MRELLEQQRAERAAKKEQHQAELAKYREEMQEMLEKTRREGKEKTEVEHRLPKLTLQKMMWSFSLRPSRGSQQQNWPEEVWPTQLAGQLTGKAMAAYAALSTMDSTEYEKVKKAILRRYQINKETHRLRFQQDRRKSEESHCEQADCLWDHFEKCTTKRDIPLEEVILLEQFIWCVPEDLAAWIKEKMPTSVRQAVELAHCLRKNQACSSESPIQRIMWRGGVEHGERKVPQTGDSRWTSGTDVD